MSDPRREAPPTSAADLDRLAERQPDQAERAREAARRYGSRRFVEMLDAQPDPETAAELRYDAEDDRVVLKHLSPGVDIVIDREALQELKRTR